jgi:hypothetical protein
MNWSDDKLINLTVSTVNDYGSKVANRQYYLDEAKNRCQFCGGFYRKFLICSEYKNLPRIFCRFCYMLTHINMGFQRQFTVAVSQLSQKEIVRRTVDFIIKQNMIPDPQDIDETAKLVPLSKMEFFAIIKSYGEVPQQISSFKCFVTQAFEIRFLEGNELLKMSMFDNDNDDDAAPVAISQHMYKFTKTEIDFLSSFFFPKDDTLREERKRDVKEYADQVAKEKELSAILKELGATL